ncbi:hypothetical protein F4821DRAFT_246587 [Hypoxylon rubiginosum]|uniref:Uncharacterized protein n=1 Tax=Hypoxylon rubiginosum TaxID=110542 RepID=A0ACC0CQQ3_9PEZI|nr:hypothetical protein F4821DRAFT_246587 [Hypoxylon rubiginosum]
MASCLSIASFIGLVVTASLYSGRPLDCWPLRVITINGAVAALTAIMKGTLLVRIADSVSQAKWCRSFSKTENRSGIWNPLTTSHEAYGEVLPSCSIKKQHNGRPQCLGLSGCQKPHQCHSPA